MLEPKFSRVPGPSQKNNGRWMFYYPAIADWMLDHPGGRLSDCAAHMNRTPQTISHIINSDMFQEYFRKRREQWTKDHDHAIVGKTTQVAEAALDLMLEKLEKQGDKIPMQLVTEVATSTLDRLGYGPKKGPEVQVNVDNSDKRQVVINSVTIEALAEAREALRIAERQSAHREDLALPAAVVEPRVEDEEPYDPTS